MLPEIEPRRSTVQMPLVASVVVFRAAVLEQAQQQQQCSPRELSHLSNASTLPQREAGTCYTPKPNTRKHKRGTICRRHAVSCV